MKKKAKKLILTKETLRGLEGTRLRDVAGASDWTCYTSCQISEESCKITCDTCFPC